MAKVYELHCTAQDLDKKLSKINGDKNYYDSEQIDSKILDKADLINGKIPQDQIEISFTVDQTNNLISSNAVFEALQSKQNSNLTLNISEQSSNEEYPSAKAVYDIIEPLLPIDSIPTLGNNKPISSNGVKQAMNEVIQIAEGKCKTYVMDTVDTMVDWLTNYADIQELNTGDIFLIRDLGVPDYWWEPQGEFLLLSEYEDKDISIGTKGIARVLETAKVDLKDYALKSQIPTIPTNISSFINDKGYALTSQIPAIPSSLPANGGNSNTVGGLSIVVSQTPPTTNDMSILTFVY